jgi:hypothetical protein
VRFKLSEDHRKGSWNDTRGGPSSCSPGYAYPRNDSGQETVVNIDVKLLVFKVIAMVVLLIVIGFLSINYIQITSGTLVSTAIRLHDMSDVREMLPGIRVHPILSHPILIPSLYHYRSDHLYHEHC